ncbi:MAG: hypothetical protein FJX11_01000 [Alphaproteobacteria bacterium]|nr:hypothetical protein [Alphaproteobacteria bacterium]
MNRASLVAALAVSLSVAGLPLAASADERLQAEERLLGMADEQARDEAYQPFTREIARSGKIARTFDEALVEAGVAAATMLDARRALATVLDIERDVRPGDRFYVRY